MSLFSSLKDKLLKDYQKTRNFTSNQVSNFRVGANQIKNRVLTTPSLNRFDTLSKTAPVRLANQFGVGVTDVAANQVMPLIRKAAPYVPYVNYAMPSIKATQPKLQTLVKNNPAKTTGEKIARIAGENLPAMLLPATKGITAAKVANPLTRLAYNSLLRGGENAAYNTAVKVARNEKITPKGVLGDVAVGAAFNTALSPKQLIKGVKYQNIVDAMDAPLANKYTKVIQDGKITANLYKPKTNLKTFSVKDFAVKYLGSDPMVNNYKIDLSGSVDAHFDPQTGKLLSWSTDNPNFAKGIQGGKLSFGLSTRNVKPSENPLSNEAIDKNGLKLTTSYGDKIPLNRDGTITVFHSTTPEAAQKIATEGLKGSRAEKGDVFFTTDPKGYGNIGKGKDVVLSFNIDPRKVQFDDSYQGTLHLRGNENDLKGIFPNQPLSTTPATPLSNEARKIETTKKPLKYLRGDNVGQEYGFDLKKTVNGKDIGNVRYDKDAGNFSARNYEGKTKYFKTQKGAEDFVENSFNNKKSVSLQDYMAGYNNQPLSTTPKTKTLLVKTEKKSPYQSVEWPADKPIPPKSKAVELTPQSGVTPELPPSSRPSIRGEEQTKVATPAKTIPIARAQEVSNKIGSDVSFDNTIQRIPTDVKNKVNIIDMVRTPDRVLNKIGLGEEANIIRTQYDKYIKELPQEIDKISKWADQTTPEENTNIFKFLDGQNVKLSSKEQTIATEVKTYLKDWADKLNLPEDKRISNYITHIFDKDLNGKEFPEELAKIIDEKVAGSVYDPFVTERLGKRGYIEDTWRALDAYAKRATRKYNIDVALEPIKEKAKTLELSQYKYVKNYIDRINMRPTEFDNMVDNFIKSTPIGYKLGQRPTTTLTRNARQMVYRGTLGLNVGSTLKNLSQGANTYARLGERYTVKGYLDLFKNYNSSELKDVGVLADDLIQDKNIGVYRGFLSKLDKGLFYMFETAEKINRGAAYYGAKAKALNEGKPLNEAIDFAKKTVRDTQFTFGSIDTPPILQSDAAKTLLQFQSFNIKQGEFLGEMIANKDLAGLTRWIGASMAFVYGVGKAIGMSPKDIIPTLRVGGSPIFTTVKEGYNAITNAEDEYGNKPENTSERMQPLIKSLVPLIPGGVQGKKTIEGLGAVGRGYVKTAKGLVRNPITQNTGNQIKGALFGQNNLPESQTYFNTKQNPLGKEQSQIFKTVSDKADYYKSVLTQRANDKEIEKLKGGNGGTTSAGTIVKKIGNEWKTFDTQVEADKAIEKDNFDKSGKKSALINGTYYYKDKAGKVRDMSEDEFNLKMTTAKLEAAYDSKNYKEYVKVAEEKLKLIEAQFESADPLTQIELQNDYNDLLAKVNKYQGYGGFTKPKKAKKAKKVSLAKPTKLSQAKISLPKPQLKAMKVSTNGGLRFKRPTATKSGSIRLKRGV